MPCGDEDPCGREGGHVFEVLPDVLRHFLQYFRLHRLSIVHVSTDTVVHVCPEWSDEGSAVTQRKGLRRELADLHVKGDHAVVVHLQTQAAVRNALLLPLLTRTSVWTERLRRWNGTDC